ncbi:MAG: hypothetical protein RL322_1918 [Pseudomonadota bacterium]|jgi:oligopeptide/dipeptide ABC transporter ATP-binding protein
MNSDQPLSGPTAPALVEGEGLVRAFARKGGWLSRSGAVRALRGVDLSIQRGEAVGVVGESGCGKSTLGRVVLGLSPLTEGRIRFDGHSLTDLPAQALRALRRRMQIVFQDPYGSLDPRRTVGAQIADGLLIHRLCASVEIPDRVAALLKQVGLDPVQAGRLPHEFSGGQRQRIAVARALATRPDFIVADEPVSALDVSVQAQVVNLFSDLQAELGLALMFISHDLHVVRHLCDRVVVMYLGLVVEEAPAAELFHSPAHPYTRALLAATPALTRRSSTVSRLEGEVPSVAAPPSGCGFRTRCPHAQPRCSERIPTLRSIPGAAQRKVACHFAEQIAS